MDLDTCSHNQLSLIAVGDVCLSQNFEQKVAKKALTFPFELVQDKLLSADLRFGNLEFVFPGDASTDCVKQLWANNQLLDIFIDAKFDVMSCANNHIMDCKEEGLHYTLKLLEDQNILTVGAGNSLKQARRPAILKHKGIQLGFLAYADDEGQIASQANSGVAEAKKKHVLADIAALKKKSRCCNSFTSYGD
jgi:poly-gamma-glutamate synthesis protein (capsule biosynthesis protein)